jgi:hypothetical protein
LSRTTETMTRVRRIQALPWQIAGSTLMCSRQESMPTFYIQSFVDSRAK